MAKRNAPGLADAAGGRRFGGVADAAETRRGLPRMAFRETLRRCGFFRGGAGGRAAEGIRGVGVGRAEGIRGVGVGRAEGEARVLDEL